MFGYSILTERGDIMSATLMIIIGIMLIFVCTTLGASFIFIFKNKKPSEKAMEISLGFSGGIMMSASVFSLIVPAINAQVSYMNPVLITAISILLGAGFFFLIDKLVPHIHTANNVEEGIKTKKMSKMSKMFLAVTIHNIPEGLAVGVAFGIALSNYISSSSLDINVFFSALMLAIGIGIQNIPEGFSVALPIKSETGNSGKAFLFGMLSGAVEPIAAGIGLIFAYSITVIMPWALAFAGGCMLYVIIEEMVPESKASSDSHYGVWSFIVGFIIMMVLDVLLG